MPEIETILWEVLVGNRFTKTLDTAMLSDAVLIKFTTVRRTGDAVKKAFNVKYNRDYVIRYIGRLICRPLFILGKEKVIKLIAEAWDYWYENEATAYDKSLVTK